MKRYEIERRDVEIKGRDEFMLKAGVTLEEKYFCENPITVQSFNTLEEAREVFKEYSESIVRTFNHNNMRYYYVTEWCIVEYENEDEDGFPESVNYLDFSKMTFTVIDEEYNIIGIFDNYRDADDAFREAENPLNIQFY